MMLKHILIPDIVQYIFNFMIQKEKQNFCATFKHLHEIYKNTIFTNEITLKIGKMKFNDLVIFSQVYKFTIITLEHGYFSNNDFRQKIHIGNINERFLTYCTCLKLVSVRIKSSRNKLYDFSKMMKLQELHLECLNICNGLVEILDKCKNLIKLILVEVNISKNGLIHILSTMTNLRTFKYLREFSNPKSFDLFVLNNISISAKLESFAITFSDYFNFNIINNKSTLKKLSIDYNITDCKEKISNQMECLINFHNLVKLDVYLHFYCDNKRISFLSKLTNLRSLDIDCWAINSDVEETLSKLNHLYKLNLFNSKYISNFNLKFIAHLTQLNYIIFYNLNIKDADFKYLSNCINLRKIKISGTHIYGSDLHYLSKCVNLQLLNLSGNNNLNYENLIYITRLTNLTNIYLHNVSLKNYSNTFKYEIDYFFLINFPLVNVFI